MTLFYLGAFYKHKDYSNNYYNSEQWHSEFSIMTTTLPRQHYVNANLFDSEVSASIVFGMGCFWGAERLFWQQEGVELTAVGYAGGHVGSPSYQQVCTGSTGHAEVVWVAFEESNISLDQLLELFWTSHDPTQGNRQGNDAGSQYRSAIYMTNEDQLSCVLDSRDRAQQALDMARYGAITTEIAQLDTLYWAEEYHQQYLGKNPNGYCGLRGCNIHYA